MPSLSTPERAHVCREVTLAPFGVKKTRHTDADAAQSDAVYVGHVAPAAPALHDVALQEGLQGQLL